MPYDYQESQELFKFLLQLPHSRRTLCNELLQIAQHAFGATSQRLSLNRLLGWTKSPSETGFQSAPKWARAAGLVIALKGGYELNTEARIRFAVQTWLAYHTVSSKEDTVNALKAELPLANEWLPLIGEMIENHAKD